MSTRSNPSGHAWASQARTLGDDIPDGDITLKREDVNAVVNGQSVIIIQVMMAIRFMCPIYWLTNTLNTLNAVRVHTVVKCRTPPTPNQFMHLTGKVDF